MPHFQSSCQNEINNYTNLDHSNNDLDNLALVLSNNQIKIEKNWLDRELFDLIKYWINQLIIKFDRTEV